MERVIVFEQGRPDGDWPPTDAAGFLSWVAEKIEAIPKEYRATARVEIDSEIGIGIDHYPCIEIYYYKY